MTATVTAMNNLTANIDTGVSKGSTTGFTIFKNIAVSNGSFSVNCRFLRAGTHQIIAEIKSKINVFVDLASFNVLVSSS